MERVTVYLRTSLFSVPGPEAHVPPAVTIVEGRVTGRPSGALAVETERLLDDRGRLLAEKVVHLELPWSKIDHVLSSGPGTAPASRE